MHVDTALCIYCYCIVCHIAYCSMKVLLTCIVYVYDTVQYAIKCSAAVCVLVVLLQKHVSHQYLSMHAHTLLHLTVSCCMARHPKQHCLQLLMLYHYYTVLLCFHDYCININRQLMILCVSVVAVVARHTLGHLYLS
jgi:hypothetical protein